MDRFSRRGALKLFAAASVLPAARGWTAEVDSGAKLFPPLSQAKRKDYSERLVSYFRKNAPLLLRPAKGVLHYPTVSASLPGEQYSTQLWDWDTLFTGQGLFALARVLDDRELHARVCLHVKGSLLSFLEYQSAAGRIPRMVSVNNPDPFGSLRRECPHLRNQAKPVMAQIALLLANEMREVEWLAPQFEKLLRFYDAWILGNRTAIGLLVWGGDFGIGDDNDPTTYGRPFFSSANVLLNCLYYRELTAAAELARRLGRMEDQERLAKQANELGVRIQGYCWDPRDHFYYTVDVQCENHRGEFVPEVPPGMNMSWRCLPLRIQMFTGFLPMWCGLATRQQAAELVQRHYVNQHTFWANYGVRSLSNMETMYSLARSSNPSNWLGPIWIIVSYLVWKGLRDYGFVEEAANLADKTIHLLGVDVATSGSLNEYYDPDTGTPLSVKGFMDWNLLVLEMI